MKILAKLATKKDIEEKVLELLNSNSSSIGDDDMALSTDDLEIKAALTKNQQVIVETMVRHFASSLLGIDGKRLVEIISLTLLDPCAFSQTEQHFIHKLDAIKMRICQGKWLTLTGVG